MGDNLDDALETFVASDELEKEIEQEVRSAEPALEQGSEENKVAAEQTPSATDADDAFIAEHLNSLQSAEQQHLLRAQHHMTLQMSQRAHF